MPRKAVHAGLVMLAAACCASVLSGCQAVDAVSGMLGSTEIGQKLQSSRTSEPEDYENYAKVQSPTGEVFSTVIQVVPVGTSRLDTDKLRQSLEVVGANWYQAITGDSRGTGNQEYGYVYFPATITYAEMSKICSTIATDYEAHVMTLEEYEQYKEEAKNRVNLYYVESTFYGPASQPVDEGGEGGEGGQ